MSIYDYRMTTAAKTEAEEQKKTGGRWAVGYTIPAETQDDRTEKMQFCAYFDNPVNAEMFIDCLPEEQKKRFFITRIDTVS